MAEKVEIESTSRSSSLLELANVSKFYYKKGMITTGFSKINLKFELGEFVAITGESGSGKSTLLNVLSGLDSYEEGELYINGEETSYYTEKDYEKYRKKYISNIFQSFNLVNSYTVYQNIELVLLLNGYKKREIKDKILNLINEVGLTEFKNKKVSKLSGGQKQRVAIARALAMDTPIILADEPTGSLDKKSSESVLKLLHDISKEKLVIIVTHNYDQIADYVTRKITMNDGKVIEDKKLRTFTECESNVDAKNNKMRFFSKLLIGFRNAFNIPAKFLIISFVYLFVIVSLFAVYAFFNIGEVEESSYNLFFNTDGNRVVLTKNDSSAFTDEDYKKISKISNINETVKRDVLIDNMSSLRSSDDNFYFYGYVREISNLKKVDYGKMPSADNEIVFKFNPDFNSYLYGDLENALMLDYLFENIRDGFGNEIKFKVSGFVYDYDNYSEYIYAPDAVIDKLNTAEIKSRTSVTYKFLDNTFTSYVGGIYNELIPTNKVPKGGAYVNDDYKWSCKKEKCTGYAIDISSKNMYGTITKTVYVSKMFTKKNFSSLVGDYDYEYYNQAIFINNEDYDDLFDKNNYQSSVYLENDKLKNETLSELQKAGFDTLYLNDCHGEDSTFVRAIRIVKLIVYITLLVTMFFVSYIIVRLVLKSRNIYYSTLRILGCSYRDTKKLLIIELLVLVNLSYLIFIGGILLSKMGVINLAFINEALDYFKVYHFVIIYLSILIMSLLTSQRFSRKLFVKSVMNTYREEV